VTQGLTRYYGNGDLHFITWSCYRREPHLGTAARRDLLLRVLEHARRRYRFQVVGYVIMPEHVHLLMTEPQVGDPSVVLKVAKRAVYPNAARSREVLRARVAEALLRLQRL
jgi:putative transposase